jgi:hypothetical protein
VSGRLQLAGYGAECSTEVSADQSERCNGRDRDQRGNQCVLDGSDARLILRAIGGSTLNGFISSQENAWFVDGMVARFLLAIVFTAGYVVLVWDVLTLGRRAPAVATVAAAQ